MHKMELPTKQFLDDMDKVQRLNLFRKFLTVSRHNRLIVHHELVKSTNDINLRGQIDTLERIYVSNYHEFVDHIKKNGYEDELLVAVQEEDYALEKIISTYEKKIAMNAGFDVC